MKVQEPISEVVERTELLPGDIVFVVKSHGIVRINVVEYIDKIYDLVKVRKLGWVSRVECWKLN